MTTHRMFLSLLLISLAALSHAKMYIYPAGPVRWGNGKLLRHGSRVCPKHFHGGFNIGCTGYLKPPVKFFTNDKYVRTVNEYPFTFAPATPRYRNPFTKYRKPSWVTFKCQSKRGGHTFTARVHLTCQTAAPKRRKRPYRRHRRQAPKRPAPVPARRRKVRWVGRRGCVSIDASHPLRWRLPRGWTRERGWGGVTYQKFSKFGGVFPPGTAPLTYEFWVPKHSHYAVVLDMTTKHWTEHNDVFLKFSHGQGLNLWRFGRTRRGGRGFLKAYHNKNGRSKQAFHVDFKPHSFVTANALSPGRKYYITLGARSTQLTVHRILLFPCTGRRCSYHWWGFQRSLRSCGRY